MDIISEIRELWGSARHPLYHSKHYNGSSKEQSLLDVRTSSSSYFYLVLISNSVHDGWGIAHKKGIKGNAIEAAETTNMDAIAKDHSHRTLAAHGTAVGLSEGLMGNSEVG